MKMVVEQPKSDKSKNKFGQYFTPKIIADFMIGLADIDKESSVLEPSCGEGIFLDLLHQKGYNNVTAYEIDHELARDFEGVKYESFVSAHIEDTYDLVIGNPPYIRWKNLEENLKQELSNNVLWNKYFNSLCDYLYIFILKSIKLLNENGQLIFICPEYWLNTTHSLTLRNYMVKSGYFEEIYHFNETPIFDKVTISCIIFKFVKSKKKAPSIRVAKFYANQKLSAQILNSLQIQEKNEYVEYLEVSPFKINERWLLQSDAIKEELRILENSCRKRQQASPLNLFEEEKTTYHSIGEVCDIGNGLVSGLDKAFQLNGHQLNELEKSSILHVVKAKDLKPFYTIETTKYLYVDKELNESSLKENYPTFFHHLQPYKEDLKKRYQYNRVINYWEWVFLRNFNLFSRKEKRIFVPCKERISHKKYFRFALVEQNIFPTQDVTAIFRKPSTQESIEYITAYLNNPMIFDWLRCNGIVKGNIVEFSEKPIASIPFRKINWKNQQEVILHNSITELTKMYMITKNSELLTQINSFFDELFAIPI